MKSTVQNLCDNVGSKYSEWYRQGLKIFTKVNVRESLPRTAHRHRHPENHKAGNAEEHYQVALPIPFLDHLNKQVELRSSNSQLLEYRGLPILPKNVALDLHWRHNVIQFIDMYADHFPNIETFNVELDMWEVNCKNRVLPPCETIYELLQESTVDRVTFPNISTMLKIQAVIPVTLCKAERSIPTLRHSVTWLESKLWLKIC